MSRKSRKKATSSELVLMQNSVKTLLANIRFASVDDPIKSVTVTSTVPDEGKTIISLELAKAMAQAGKYVLLVECDMRHRTLASRLSLHPRAGIYSVLAGQERLEDAVVETPTSGLWFLDAEPHIPNPADILASRRFGQFVRQLHGEYDYVVFDTPPISAVVDAAVVGSVTDATLLVVRENYVRRDAVVASYEQLRKAEANVIGVVMNRCESASGDYYYDYYGGASSKDDEKDADGSEKRIPTMAEAPLRPVASHAAGARRADSTGPHRSGANGGGRDRVARTTVPAPDTTAQFLAGTPYSAGARDEEE